MSCALKKNYVTLDLKYVVLFSAASNAHEWQCFQQLLTLVSGNVFSSF
jgi:hypothetical protein